MKKTISLIAFFIVLFMINSCKKESVDNIPLGTIKAELNGIMTTFNIQAKATRLSVTGGYGIQVQGNYRTGSTTNFSFTIVKPDPLTTGTYTENAGGNPLVTVKHCTEVLYPCVIQAVTYGSSSNPVSITITDINNSYVKGSFKGELSVNTNGGKEILTKGVFYVSF